MRRKGSRGEPLKWLQTEVIFLETMMDRNLAKILILKTQTVTVVPKTDLSLPVIDTKDYEKIESSNISD